MKEVSARKLSKRRPNWKSKISHDTEPKEGGKFEVVDFVVRHLRIPNWRDYNGCKYAASEIFQLLDDIYVLFRSEKALCHVSPPINIVGDLNGHYQDLVRILNIRNEKNRTEDAEKPVFSCEKYVFLGDYTENGQYNFETICLLFGLKILYNARYILLRGHQETFVTHDLYDQITSKFPGRIGENMCQKFRTVFSLMPIAAVVGDKILCVHSGISHEVKRSVDEWKKIPRTETFTRLSSITRDLLFSCPVEEDGVGAESEDPIFFMPSANEYVKTFNEAAVNVFCEKTNIELIVRSHDAPPNGFRFFAEKQMITIFSATTHNKRDHTGAFLRVDEEGVVSIVQMRPTDVTAIKQDDKKRKKSGETGKKSAEKGKKSKETPKKGSKEKTSDSKDNSKESKEENDGKKKKPKSKPSKEFDSIYDNDD